MPRQLQYDLTGDAFQNAAFGSDEGALSHQVEVGAGRLQDALFFVEQQILVGLARQRVADAPSADPLGVLDERCWPAEPGRRKRETGPLAHDFRRHRVVRSQRQQRLGDDTAALSRLLEQIESNTKLATDIGLRGPIDRAHERVQIERSVPTSAFDTEATALEVGAQP